MNQKQLWKQSMPSSERTPVSTESTSPNFHTHSIETKSYRAYYIFLFLAFGTIIALLTSAINYRFDVKNAREEIRKIAKIEIQKKRSELNNFTNSLEEFTESLRSSTILHEYLRKPNQERYSTLTSLFLAIATTNPTFIQVRYLNEKGQEVVRVDRNPGEHRPEIIPFNRLQDKSHRYYFLEASQMRPNDFWYSKLDLNIEQRVIEVPHKPVLRIAAPVYLDQQFRGIVIINCGAKRFLNLFRSSNFFNISLIDRDGEFIVHHDDNRSWSRYLETGYTIHQDHPASAKDIMLHTSSESLSQINEIFVASVKSFLNQDGAAIIMETTSAALQALFEEKKRAMLFIIGLIVLLSLPLAMLLSKIPTRLSNRIAKQNKVLTEYVNLIDENIITSENNGQRLFTDVSNAFSRISGYQKNELIGYNIDILYHPDMRDNTSATIQDTIVDGKIWKGEVKYRRKDGTTFWTHTTIYPKYNTVGAIDNYTTIHRDITNRKALEKLSITDELTGLYNRRFFNTVIHRELNRAKRNQKVLSFAMMDVDHFKQYNDNYGHQRGDEILKKIARSLMTSLNRGSDFCFRLGGEEFGVIFTGLEPEEGLLFGERLRESVENLTLEHKYSETAPYITLSMGLLTILPEATPDVDQIYKMADDAMYAAKSEGRNRVISHILKG